MKVILFLCVNNGIQSPFVEQGKPFCFQAFGTNLSCFSALCVCFGQPLGVWFLVRGKVENVLLVAMLWCHWSSTSSKNRRSGKLVFIWNPRIPRWTRTNERIRWNLYESQGGSAMFLGQYFFRVGSPRIVVWLRWCCFFKTLIFRFQPILFLEGRMTCCCLYKPNGGSLVQIRWKYGTRFTSRIRGTNKTYQENSNIPGNIPQTLNHLFMKEILSYLYFGVSGVCSQRFVWIFFLKLPTMAKGARRRRLGFPFWHCAFVHRRAVEELKWKGYLSLDTGFHLSSNGHAIWWWSLIFLNLYDL